MQYAGIKGLLSRPQIFFLYIKEKMYLKLFVLIFVFKMLHILSFSSSNFDESMNVHTRVIKPHHVHVT